MKSPIKSQDIVATLTHLTAITVYEAVEKYQPDEVILTGGGVKNRFLVSLIHSLFKDKGVAVSDISAYGIPPQAKEAVSFAILGYQTLNRWPGNLPSATGAGRSVVLGKISSP
jgi:anhydro-N-acetylmuramic acid kinase